MKYKHVLMLGQSEGRSGDPIYTTTYYLVTESTYAIYAMNKLHYRVFYL